MASSSLAASEENRALFICAHALAQLPILKTVLRFIPARSLGKCAGVCRLWRDAVAKVKQKRNWTEWMCMVPINSATLKDELQQFVQNMKCQSETFLIFCSSGLYESPIVLPSRRSSRRPRSAKCQRVDFETYLKHILMGHCSILAVAAAGIVGSVADLSSTMEAEDQCGLSILSIPAMEGLKVYNFRVETDCNSFTNCNHSTVPIGQEDCVKLLLFFCDEPHCPPQIGYEMNSAFKNAIVAGGFVDNVVRMQRKNDSDVSGLCVAFCGERLRAASVILKESVKTKESVEKCLKQLKECKFNEDNSMCFMFACIGRGRGHYGVSDIESGVFSKLFPKTPIFGFFGNGEIGYTCLPSQPTNGTVPKLYHSYTTVFCLLSIN